MFISMDKATYVEMYVWTYVCMSQDCISSFVFMTRFQVRIFCFLLCFFVWPTRAAAQIKRHSSLLLISFSLTLSISVCPSICLSLLPFSPFVEFILHNFFLFHFIYLKNFCGDLLSFSSCIETRGFIARNW